MIEGYNQKEDLEGNTSIKYYSMQESLLQGNQRHDREKRRRLCCEKKIVKNQTSDS